MRLFIAVFLSNEVKTELQRLQEQLKVQSYKGSFTRHENLHLTLAFLGETEEERLNSLYQIVQEMKYPAFEIAFSRTGCFTHSGKELWWIGADPNDPNLPTLNLIHGQLINRLKEGGFPVELKPFKAHITLGREIKHSQPIVLDCRKINIKMDRLSLVKSERIRGVLTYTEIFGQSWLETSANAC
ncbi:MAG: RNA 2',3'-cyclic phosphodiesterase [Treponema sp.]|nr:RNA 2',3'-cyclic phosphodiesterase [Treponema sp.]